VGRYFGREPRYSRQEIEVQAKAAIEAAVGMGRPPEEDFLPVKARLAELDRELAARAPVVPLPSPPALRRERHAPITVSEVRLPATAKAGSRVPPAAPGTGAAAPEQRTARRPVAARER
jgi:hypothetical protein